MNTAQYIESLANSLTKITLLDFFKYIHENYYPTQDISFMEYFLELTKHKNDFVVEQEKLTQYGVITTINKSANIKRALEQYGLIESKDYNLLNVEQVRQDRGTVEKNIYTLTPYAFKICLIRAKNSKVYANYYLLLEEIYSLYTDYERLYAEKLLSMKDNKIDKMSLELREQSKLLREQSKKNDKLQATVESLLGYAKDTKATLDDVQDDLTETKEQVYIAKTYLKKKSFQSTKNPTDESKHHYFAVIHSSNNNKEYVKFIAGQKSYVDKTISKHENSELIIQPFYNANGIDLRQNVYEEYITRRNDRIKILNDQIKLSDKKFNESLKDEIRRHNKQFPENKRYFVDEKRKSTTIRIKDVPIHFSKLSFTYEKNNIFSFKDIVKIIHDVNDNTQQSPLPSDEE